MEKPAGWAPEYGAQFQDPSVVAAYPKRARYPEQTFEILSELAGGENARVLDIGAGTGDLARRLAEHVREVVAVDISAPMVDLGRSLPGGNAPALVWRVGRVQDQPFESGSFDLIVAGESLHWMDWASLFPVLRFALKPEGFLALAGRIWEDSPWDDELQGLIDRYSTNRDFEPRNVVDELSRRELFVEQGRKDTGSEIHRQSVADHIECLHSRNGFSRDRLSSEDCEAVDREYRELLERHGCTEDVEVAVRARIVWGTLPGFART